MPEDFKKEVHGPWVEDLIENGLTQSERLRLPADFKQVKVISAFQLTDEQRKKLSKKVREVVGKDVSIQEEIDPKLCAGFVIK